MVVGFNHNVKYKGDVFHIQTEDSGVNTPHIITLLYRGGTILSSKKTSYADIIKIENLEQVVEELMKEQHKDMLRRLKSGEFDARAFPGEVGSVVKPVPANKPVPEEKPVPEDKPVATVTPATEPPAPPTQPPPVKHAPPKAKMSLDEIILDYLVIGDDD